MPRRTVITVLAETAMLHGDATALVQPLPKGAASKKYTFNEWLQTSREIASGLKALGLQKGEIVCVLCETRAEFYLVDLAIMGAGGVSGALYTANTMAELARNIGSAQPRFLFVEDEKTLAALLKAVDEAGVDWPEITILITGTAAGTTPLFDVQERGRQVLQADPGASEALESSIAPEDPAILYLTSGATGEAKMGLTSHAAILANLDMAPIAFPIDHRDSTIVFLPSAHIAQRIVLELIPMRMGSTVHFSESLSKLPNELRTIRPTVFLAPPRLWERMYATILTELRKRPRYAQSLFHWALGLGLETTKRRAAGKPIPLWMSRAQKIMDKLVFSKVRARLGGRIRIAASGAAPLGKELAEFFSAIGMPLAEGYGLTETGVVCFNPLDRPKPGSIGTMLPGISARLGEDGELQLKTPCLFQGYFRDPAATALVLGPDGWFSTGDIAEVDADGYWYITGRKKELIVSSNGKKIYPARIEGLFKVEPLINQVLLVGDKKPYLTALLTINPAQAAEPDSKPALEKAVGAAVSRVNSHLADFERIRRFKIVEQEFSIERGELTPTMKIRRAQVLQNHAELVHQLYLGREDSA